MIALWVGIVMAVCAALAAFVAGTWFGYKGGRTRGNEIITQTAVEYFQDGFQQGYINAIQEVNTPVPGETHIPNINHTFH